MASPLHTLTHLCRQSLQLLALLSAVACNTASAADTSKAEAESLKQAHDAFWVGDFAEMERLFAVAKQPDDSLDGRYHRVRWVRNGFEEIFTGYKDSNDLYFAEIDALTLQWAQQNPRSALAHALHANALVARAWTYRGGGYVKDVPPEAWVDFEKYIKQAAQYLAASPISPASPRTRLPLPSSSMRWMVPSPTSAPGAATRRAALKPASAGACKDERGGSLKNNW